MQLGLHPRDESAVFGSHTVHFLLTNRCPFMFQQNVYIILQVLYKYCVSIRMIIENIYYIYFN